MILYNIYTLNNVKYANDNNNNGTVFKISFVSTLQ